MSLAVMKSPARPGSTPITNVYYKCDDCGDVSHSLASLNLHRSVCHTSNKNRNISDSEIEVSPKETDGEQIAESCECPKCGESLLLLRQHTFNCAICEFQDTDQSRFFVHLKEHYEPDAVLNVVEPGSVIIEQVIDDSNDPSNRDHVDDDDDDDDDDGIDDNDDPEYLPDNDDCDEDGEPMERSDSRSDLSWKPSPIKGAHVKKEDNQSSDSKLKSKLEIQWHTPQEKGAQKRLSFVRTAISPNKTPASRLGFSPSKTPPISKVASIKKEPQSSGGSKWVRLVDIKYLESPKEEKAGARSSASNLSKLLGSKGTNPTKTAGSSVEGTIVKKKVVKTKEKEPKPPKEKKLPVCSVCKRIFSSSVSLKVHMRIHTGEKNYTCDQCGKAFTQWSTCQQHIVAIHSGVKKYTCEFCGACFARNTGLSLHRRIHTGEKTHHCNICGKGFRCKSYLDRHRTFHTGEKRYKCEFCSKTFRTSTDMKRHRNSVHFGLGNVSLTAAKELLLTRMDGYRTPQRQGTTTVIQQFGEEDSTSSDDSQEIIRATTIITGSHYEM